MTVVAHSIEECPYCKVVLGYPYHLSASKSVCSNCGSKIRVGLLGVYCGMLSVSWAESQVHAFVISPSGGECPECGMGIKVFTVNCKEGKGWS